MTARTETLDILDQQRDGGYKYGFETTIDMEFAPKGLNEDIVRLISAKRSEPAWLLDWRLKSYRAWLTMEEPNWARLHHQAIDYQDLYYYAALKRPAPNPSLALKRS